MSGVDMIAAERQRQIDVEGYTAEHDDEHHPEDLMAAGHAYLSWAQEQVSGDDPVRAFGELPGWWPWRARDWKPSDDPIRNMVKGCALHAAAIDRLQRKRK